MKKIQTFAFVAALTVLGLPLASAARLVSIELVPSNRTLRGADALQRLLVVGKYDDGREADLTSEARIEVTAGSAVQLDADAVLRAVSDGATRVRAEVADLSAEGSYQVKDAAAKRPFRFAREIGGILTRRSCNGASCHGGVKGKNGFKLSDNAEHPREDYKWIVEGGFYEVLSAESKGPRTPRVDTNNPENSLLLLKPTMGVMHGGGQRFEKGSSDYETILEWVRNGAPYGEEQGDESRLVDLTIVPERVFLKPGETHRLVVSGRFANGDEEDLSSEVLYELDDTEVADVSPAGVVTGKQAGEVTVLVRAAGRMAAFQVGVIGSEPDRRPDVPPVNFIDEHVLSKLRKFNIIPSGLSSDEEFLRRVCLDLTGTLPPPERVREFLSGNDLRKREKLIDILLDSPEYVDYWTYRYSDFFRVAILAIGNNSKWSEDYSEWIRAGIAGNKPYDRMARERIAAQGYSGPSRHYLPIAVIGPAPDMMMEQARVFMGRRFDCARCHDHPYENWTQDQFWGLTAFFGHVSRTGTSGFDSVVLDYPMGKQIAPDVVGRRELRILNPRTGQEAQPTLLDGRVLEHKDQNSVRQELAEWMTAHPYFAEATVNRIWSLFFPRGIVNPVDDFRSTNPPTHPKLLEALAADFATNGYDIKRLIRLIAMSRTYQVSSDTNETNKADQLNFSHALPRAMDAEVLLDAITTVTGVPEFFSAYGPGAPRGENQMPAGTRAIQLRETDLFQSQFLDVYGRPNRASVPERSAKPNLGQALHVLVGSTYNDKLWKPGSRVYDLYESGATDDAIIEELYLAALTRFPTDAERQTLKGLIAKAASREEGLKNLQWGMLSSREFAENH
jgi:hypothetical protein